jgi:hypothetical protein
MAKCFPEYPHNYNQVSREVMYNWFNKHLALGQKEPVTEQAFEPVPPKELSVYDAEHPRPKDELKVDALRKQWTATNEKQMEALRPKDAASLKEFQRVVGTALRVMVHDSLPKSERIDVKNFGSNTVGQLLFQGILLSRKDRKETVGATMFSPMKFDKVIVWVDAARSADKEPEVPPEVYKILPEKEAALMAVGPLLVSNPDRIDPPVVDSKFAGYTFGYNCPLLADRIQDILTAVAYAKGLGIKKVYLVGTGKAGAWVLLARALCGDAVDRCVVDMDGFRFDKVTKTNDEMMLPGALKYGGLPAFAALCAPHDLYLYNHKGTGMGQWVKPAYDAAKAGDHLKMDGEKVEVDKVIEWLLR